MDWMEFLAENAFLVLLGALLVLVFLVGVIIKEARLSTKTTRKTREQQEKTPLEDQDLAIVLDKVRSAAEHAKHFFQRYDQEIQSRESDIQSKNRVIRVLEDRLKELNEESKKQGKTAMARQPGGYWADPRLVEQMREAAAAKARRAFILGCAFGLIIMLLLFVMLLQLTDLWGEIGARLGF